MKFAQQIVWITGASSGIGKALAHAFAGEGAKLILSSRRPEELERVRRACPRADEHAIVPLDLARSDTIAAVASGVVERHGRIDVLVNNGGVSQRARAIDALPAVERAIMEVNYFGPVALTKAVLPHMIARHAGHVVAVSSVMGYLGTPGRSTYAAAKHALHGYFDSLRAEVWRDGIAVTLACPGYVKTAISQNALGPNGEKHVRTDPTTNSGISPQKCAQAIVRAVAGRKNEVYVGGREVWGIYLQRFAPRLLARLVRQMTFSVDEQR
jgi:dehydrogenase/reductase SDR family member 7B